MKTILHYLNISAPASVVFTALTTEEGLVGWWSTTVRIDRDGDDIVDFTFMEGFNPDMRVDATERESLVRWTCIGGHENWLDNTFSFDLRPEGDATRLMFTQHYARELSDEVYGEYNYNWAYYLRSLKLLCESGEGTPFSPPG